MGLAQECADLHVRGNQDELMGTLLSNARRAPDVLDYLLAVLLAPLLRRLIGVSFKLSAIAFAVTMPARLWVGLVESHPSETTLVVLNAVTVGVLFVLLARRGFRRGH